MNERIKELAVQIGFPMGYDNPEWAYEQDIYKFAELIVRECANLFPAEYDNVKGKTTIGKIIKNHFGVEE